MTLIALTSARVYSRSIVGFRIVQKRSYSFIRVSEEVRAAINARKPVVALETTIYTHGYPYPLNVTLAKDLENLVRQHGAIPATIGVLNGIAQVGFTSKDLEELAAAAGKPETKKLSRRDLGYICGLGFTGRRLNGGTTIAGTMILAHMAGIKIFATGGLGGVHRGGENSLDISADLTELGRTPTTVISSGCKSFLDIPRTLEFLETQGVFVGTFSDGRPGTVDFPAFWTRDSGIPSPVAIQDEKEAAAITYAQSRLGISSGLLFANPISERHSIAKVEMDAVIAQALKEAEKLGINGSDVTPFVLENIRSLTQGDATAANRSLIESNVIRGTKVAVELADIETQRSGEPNPNPVVSNSSGENPNANKVLSSSAKSAAMTNEITSSPEAMSGTDSTDVIVAGALAIDLSCTPVHPNRSTGSLDPQIHTSNPAVITQGLGGVGQNVATALHYLKVPVRLCSVIADDVAGAAALKMLADRGLSTMGIERLRGESRTAQYVAFNNAHKELFVAMADMRIMERRADFERVWRPHLNGCIPKWLVVDANWDEASLHKWLTAGRVSGALVAYEPVSVLKSKRLFASSLRSGSSLGVTPCHNVNLATPNSLELASMHVAAREAQFFDREDWWRTIDAMDLSSQGSRDKLVAITNGSLVDEGVPQQSIQLLPFIPSIVTKLGKKGVLLTQLLRPNDARLTSSAFAAYILSRAHVDNQSFGGVYMRLFSSVEHVSDCQIQSVNGVGDTFLGVLIAGLLTRGPTEIESLIDIAQRGSVMTLKSLEAVSPEISKLRLLLDER